MTDLPTYVLDRVFDAPRELVWRTWTEPDLVSRWYGPNVETIVHRMDVEPGGAWLVEMRMGERSMFQRMDYTEVEAPARLVGLMASTDSDWNVVASPMMPDWPRILLTAVTLDDAAGTTRLRLEWQPHDATEAEIACFAGAVENMGKGWNAGMAILENLLAELQG